MSDQLSRRLVYFFEAVLVFTFLCSFCLVIWKGLHGIDLTDQAGYMSMAVRIAYGETPFVDEIMLHQTFGLILFILYKPFLWISESNDYLVLYSNLLYTFFLLLNCYLSIQALKKIISIPKLMGIMTPYVAFLFVVGLSYNTMMLGFMLTSVSYLVSCYQDPSNSSKKLLVSGFFLGMAITSYTPLFFINIVVFPSLIIFYKKEKVIVFKTWVLGQLIGGIPLMYAIIKAGPKAVITSISMSKAMAPVAGGNSKFSLMWNYFLDGLHPWYPLVVFLVGATYLLYRSYKYKYVYLMFYTSVFSFCMTFFDSKYNLDLISNSFLFCTFILMMIRKDKVELRPLISFSLPVLLSLILFISYISTNAIISGIYGIILILIFTTLFVIKGTQINLKNEDHKEFKLSLTSLVIIIPMFLGFFMRTYKFTYRDGKVAELTAIVSKGPYKGIRTLPVKKEFLDELVELNKTYVASGDLVAYYNTIPAGYLTSRNRSAVCGAIIYNPYREGVHRKHYLECVRNKLHLNKKMVFFRLKRNARDAYLKPVPEDFFEPDPFDRALRSCVDKELHKGQFWDIFTIQRNCLSGS